MRCTLLRFFSEPYEGQAWASPRDNQRNSSFGYLTISTTLDIHMGPPHDAGGSDDQLCDPGVFNAIRPSAVLLFTYLYGAAP